MINLLERFAKPLFRAIDAELAGIKDEAAKLAARVDGIEDRLGPTRAIDMLTQRKGEVKERLDQ